MEAPSTPSTAAVAAFLDAWDELPRLLGPRWGALFPAVAELLEQLLQEHDPGRREEIAGRLCAVLAEHEELSERLRKPPRPTVVHGGFRRRRDRREPTLGERIAGLLSPPVVPLHTDVTAPRHLGVRARGVVTVRLTHRQAAASAGERRLEPREGRLEVFLDARADDFEVEEAVQSLRVERGRDSRPVVFYLEAVSPGHKRLALDFRQHGVSLGVLPFYVEVESDRGEESQRLDEVILHTGGPYAPPPDLDLRVTVEDRGDSTRLEYVLHSPNGSAPFHYRRFPGTCFRGSPAEHQQHLMRRIESLAAGKDVDGHLLAPAEVEDKLRGIGRQLYEELFPEEMRGAYRQFREVVETLQITSDEPWIPWEMVRPWDAARADDPVDDDFFCMRFAMTRWSAGRGGPPGGIAVSRWACVALDRIAGQKPLPFVAGEAQILRRLAAAAGMREATPAPTKTADIAALLEKGGIGLWHFASHGNMDFSRPDESVILLASGPPFQPGDLHGPRAAQVGRDRPLVFLNACRVGQQAWALTRLGGWAAAWVDRCRCGSFVGPLWAVDDELACELAYSFYEELLAGSSLGQALRSARSKLRESAPANPTWLAYSLYGHPCAHLAVAADAASAAGPFDPSAAATTTETSTTSGDPGAEATA